MRARGYRAGSEGRGGFRGGGRRGRSAGALGVEEAEQDDGAKVLGLGNSGCCAPREGTPVARRRAGRRSPVGDVHSARVVCGRVTRVTCI